MPSWRDTTSQQAQDDLDRLLQTVLPFAQQMLGEHGELYPFAAAITTDGELELIAGVPDLDDEHPSSTAVASACMEASSTDGTSFAPRYW